MIISFDIDSSEFDYLLVKRLQETYIDHVSHWMNEPDSDKLADSLLTTIQHFMIPSEYDQWYETIKDL